MKKITQVAGAVGTKPCDRSRTVKFRRLAIGRIARARGAIDHDSFNQRYRLVSDTKSRVMGRPSASAREAPDR